MSESLDSKLTSAGEMIAYAFMHSITTDCDCILYSVHVDRGLSHLFHLSVRFSSAQQCPNVSGIGKNTSREILDSITGGTETGMHICRIGDCANRIYLHYFSYKYIQCIC